MLSPANCHRAWLAFVSCASLALLPLGLLTPARAQTPPVQAPAQAVAQNVGGEEALAAGGLVLVANGDVRIESQDVTISAARIRIVQVMRNTADRDVNLLVSFPLPEIDTAWIWELPPLLPRSGDDNFVEASTTADGEPVHPRLDQRAIALGLDVTDSLRDYKIALFPYASGVLDKIARLPSGVKDDLIARGVLKANNQGLMPAWVLRSTIHWRQRFAAGRQITLAHSYRPVVGRPTGALAPFEKSACLDAAEARRLEGSAGGNKPARLTSVAFLATAGAAWSEPIGRFKLTVEKSTPATTVVTCRAGLAVVSPLMLEWNARDHAHEDDLTILFVE